MAVKASTQLYSLANNFASLNHLEPINFPLFTVYKIFIVITSVFSFAFD